MDGERLPARTSAALDRHLAGCDACAGFEHRARRLRSTIRIRPAEAIPDLVDAIVGAVAAEAAERRALSRSGPTHPSTPRAGAGPTPLRPRRRRPSLVRLGRLAPIAAAALAGLVAGSVTVGGPWPPTVPPPIAVADVAEGVTTAATELESYRASFAVVERNLDADTPLRELTVRVWFRAPDRFRLDVVDHSKPVDRQPTDLSLVVNRSRWALTAPSACPPGIGRACPPVRTSVRVRPAVSPGLPVPTDLVLPLDTVAAATDVTVLGHAEVLGREAIRVEVPLQAARPLLAFTQLGGAWRPFFEGDRVELWLDAESWFPLRARVFPAAGSARDRWEQRFGLPDEGRGRAVFEIQAIEVDEAAAAPGTFRIPDAHGRPAESPSAPGPTGGAGGEEGQPATPETARPDEPPDEEPEPVEPQPGPERPGVGGSPLDPADVGEAIGFEPGVPERLVGLPAVGAVVRPDADGRATEALVAYAMGLTWIEVGVHATWDGDDPFGPVGRLAEEVELADGVAYYEPATAARGRRLSIHGNGVDLSLETNLPRTRLLEAAEAIGVDGEPMPESWRERRSADELARRVSIEEAAEIVPFDLLVPEPLPTGYALAGAELIEREERVSLTLHLRHLGSDLLGAPIRVHLSESAALPPASSAGQVTVRLSDGTLARWSPQPRLLEWVTGQRYVSVDAAGLDLDAAGGLAVGFVAGAVLTMTLQGSARIPDLPGALPTASPTPPAAVVGPADPSTFLAWVPGGLPPRFARRAAALHEVRRAVVVASDNTWLTRSRSAGGELVDDPRAPFAIPLEVAAVDPRAYARFLPPADRSVTAALAEGRGVLGTSSASLRGLGPGAVLEFGDVRVTIAAVLPDELVGANELLVSRVLGRRIGVTRDRYALLQLREDADPTRLASRLRTLLPAGARLRIRAPGETPYFRHGDAVLPPVQIKLLFGEFAARPAPGRPGFLQIDPAWVRANVATRHVPLLGRVTCHRAMFPALSGAVHELRARGLDGLIDDFAGCWSPRHINRIPTANLSHHSWGIAVDINVAANPFGAPPSQDRRLVRVFERWGFVWGGRFVIPDGMHFEYRRPPAEP
jgi:outer membrane lipoprotein-sorting protein